MFTRGLTLIVLFIAIYLYLDEFSRFAQVSEHLMPSLERNNSAQSALPKAATTTACCARAWYSESHVQQHPLDFPIWLASNVTLFDAIEANLDVNTTWVIFHFTDIKFGFTSAVRRLVTLSLFSLAMGRRMGIFSQGWHYASNSSWETFFEQSTMSSAPFGAIAQHAARDARHHRVAYFYRRPQYVRVLQRYLHLAAPSTYATARRILFTSMWIPKSNVRTRVRNAVC